VLRGPVRRWFLFGVLVASAGGWSAAASAATPTECNWETLGLIQQKVAQAQGSKKLFALLASVEGMGKCSDKRADGARHALVARIQDQLASAPRKPKPEAPLDADDKQVDPREEKLNKAVRSTVPSPAKTLTKLREAYQSIGDELLKAQKENAGERVLTVLSEERIECALLLLRRLPADSKEWKDVRGEIGILLLRDANEDALAETLVGAWKKGKVKRDKLAGLLDDAEQRAEFANSLSDPANLKLIASLAMTLKDPRLKVFRDKLDAVARGLPVVDPAKVIQDALDALEFAVFSELYRNVTSAREYTPVLRKVRHGVLLLLSTPRDLKDRVTTFHHDFVKWMALGLRLEESRPLMVEYDGGPLSGEVKEVTALLTGEAGYPYARESNIRKDLKSIPLAGVVAIEFKNAGNGIELQISWRLRREAREIDKGDETQSLDEQKQAGQAFAIVQAITKKASLLRRFADVVVDMEKPTVPPPPPPPPPPPLPPPLPRYRPSPFLAAGFAGAPYLADPKAGPSGKIVFSAADAGLLGAAGFFTGAAIHQRNQAAAGVSASYGRANDDLHHAMWCLAGVVMVRAVAGLIYYWAAD